MDNDRLLRTTKTIKPNKIKGYRTMTDSPRLLFGRYLPNVISFCLP